MSRTLTAGVTTEVGAPVTTPGYLVEILFATPLRLSSRASVAWRGATWLPWEVAVRGIGFDVSATNQSGSLRLGDTDATITALVNGEGIADRPVNIWAFYGASPGASDPVQVFAGVGDVAQWDAADAVTITLEQANASTMFAPRLYVTPAAGFNHLPVPGTLIYWGGEMYELQAE